MAKCECGADRFGAPMHLDWCPKATHTEAGRIRNQRDIAVAALREMVRAIPLHVRINKCRTAIAEIDALERHNADVTGLAPGKDDK